MNISISGSCEINKFEILNFEKKLTDVLGILPEVNSLSIYISENENDYRVGMKGTLEIGGKQKCIIFHTLGDSKNDSINLAIKKLTNKYFKLKNKYRHINERPSLKIAV